MKVFLYCVAAGNKQIGYAMQEDGEVLASTIQDDKNVAYLHLLDQIPNDLVVEEIDESDLDNHEGYQQALEINKRAWQFVE